MPPPAAPASTGTKARIRVTDLSKHGPQYRDVVKYLRWFADTDLCAECSHFFGGKERLKKYIDDLLKYDLLAVGRATDLKNPSLRISAFVNTGGVMVPAGFMAMFIDLDGVFFNETLDICGYRGGSDAARKLLLGHELAHALERPGIVPDLDDLNGCIANTRLVLANCLSTFISAHSSQQNR